MPNRRTEVEGFATAEAGSMTEFRSSDVVYGWWQVPLVRMDVTRGSQGHLKGDDGWLKGCDGWPWP